MNNVEKDLLKNIADIEGELTGAYNIRKNGKGIERKVCRKVGIYGCDRSLNRRGIVLHRVFSDKAAIGPEHIAHKFLCGFGRLQSFDFPRKIRRNSVKIKRMYSAFLGGFS